MSYAGYLPTGDHWAARVLEPPTEEPITPENLISRARLVGSDAEADLIPGYITAARQQVEQDTGCALLTQRIEVAFDRFPCWCTRSIPLPWPPLQEVESLTWMASDGTEMVVDPTNYVVDDVSIPARLFWSSATTGGASLQPWRLVLTVGWTQETLPELLRHAVGLLATHYLTAGRDRVVIGTIVAEMPAGYAEAVQPYRLVTLI